MQYLDIQWSKSIQYLCGLEENNFSITKLYNDISKQPEYLNVKIEELANEGFGAVISLGWFIDDGKTNRVSRKAKRLLTRNGIFIGCVAGRYAVSIDNIADSVTKASSIANTHKSRQMKKKKFLRLNFGSLKYSV